MPEESECPRLRIKVQILAGDSIALGPGKVVLLKAIKEAGSITAAARSLGLSYRRAWMMADVMNRSFKAPLIETAHGGARGGGARLTELGNKVLRQYQLLIDAVDQTAQQASQDLLAQIQS